MYICLSILLFIYHALCSENAVIKNCMFSDLQTYDYEGKG